MSHPGGAVNWVTPPLFEAWTFDLWVAVPLGLAVVVYVRGWRRLHRRVPQRFGTGRLAAFVGGMVAIGTALESPLHALGAQWLQAHMVQHLVLMMVAPPLLWLGAPLLPMLSGLPKHLLHRWVGPLVAWPLLTRSGRWLVRPPVAWVVFVGSTWVWHTPALYERALASEGWHDAQHACFLATALAFWWPVVQPWPSRPVVPPWGIVLYLILADLQNTVLSAWLVFAERLIYPSYAAVSRPWGISALNDQAAAGAIMWVPGSVAFLFPVAWLVGQLLSPKRPQIVVLGRQPVVERRFETRMHSSGRSAVNEALDDQTHVAQPHVIIVGGGFGGLAAARALKNAPVRVTLLDRMNHHLFQPLLYQVATAILSPGDIASPIREVLRKQRNATVALLEVTRVDAETRQVFFTYLDGEEQSLPYDYLILATGVQQSYFGHDEFAAFAPGLKSINDATAIRAKLLKVFEIAEIEVDPAQHRDLLTFVLVGAGPTGVEMAGAIADMLRGTLKSDFRRIDPRAARIILVEGAPRILPTFAESLSQKAYARLVKMGVEIRTNARVERVDAEGVVVGGERIMSRTVLWTAGVTPSPAGQWLKAETDRAGRVRVLPDLTVPGRPEVFVVGDTAALDQDGKPLPGVAQVAMQQGRHAGNVIAKRVTGQAPPRPFRYVDKGNMAVIGRNFAILESGRLRLSGFIAWLAWAAIHMAFLPQAGKRVMVFTQWAWSYVTKQRGSRLILEPHVTPIKVSGTKA